MLVVWGAGANSQPFVRELSKIEEAEGDIETGSQCQRGTLGISTRKEIARRAAIKRTGCKATSGLCGERGSWRQVRSIRKGSGMGKEK